jgi:phage baseplate assembly protein gpV
MKTLIQLLCLHLGCCFLLTTTAIADELTTGREFYLGIPHCKKPTGEVARGVPIQLWIASVTANKVVVEAKGIGFSRTITITPGEVKTVSLPDSLMNTESEIKRPYGIHIVADEPVTVTCYMSYKSSGESFGVIPKEYLEKEYYTLNLWQDYTNDYKPGQILVVGTEDGTRVTYTPTAHTDTVEAGVSRTVVLNAGETFLIQSRVKIAYNQDDRSDLSGTHITANKPIAVFSGHTKGAFPRFSATMLALPANFMRNLLIEQMPPISLLDTVYVSVPTIYLNRPPNIQDIDAQGDLVRFIATQDNTNLYTRNADGSTSIMKQNMKKGEAYTITSQTAAKVYISSKPVLAGQYAKAWRLDAVPPILAAANGKVESPANPARTGQGMMYTLTPRSAWASSALFHSPDGMNNFVNITFLTDQIDSLMFDNRSFKVVFGSKIQEIPGSPYSYVSSIISAGNHNIRATTGANDAKFAAYVYGNYDATKDGFAYGYPVGINYALPMAPDSITITSTMMCGNAAGEIRISTASKLPASGFHSILLAPSPSNYKLTLLNPLGNGVERVSFRLDIIDRFADASAILEITDRTGHVTRQTYSYIAEKVTVADVDLNFTVPDVSTCSTITIHNPLDNPVQIQDIRFRVGRAYFQLKSLPSFPHTLAANSSLSLPFCAFSPATGEFIDSLEVVLSCYSLTLAAVRATIGKPRVSVTDMDFGTVEVGKQQSGRVTITNISESNIPVVLDTLLWHNSDIFTTTGIMDRFPIVLPEQGDTFTFTVLFSPSAERSYNDEARFIGNTDDIKPVSSWSGRGILSTSVPETGEQAAPVLSVSPQPASGIAALRYRLTTPATVTLSLYNLLGERVAVLYTGSQQAGMYEVPFDTRSLSAGMYLCRLEAGNHTEVQQLQVVR